MSSQRHRPYLEVCPVIRGAGFDGRRGPVVRHHGPVESADGWDIEIPETEAFDGDGVHVEGIIHRIAAFVGERGVFPRGIRVGDHGYTIGDRPEQVDSVDGPSVDPASERRWASAFVGDSGDSAQNGKGIVEGRIAAVTGGAQGFGLEIASALVRAGAIVFLSDVNVEGAGREAERLNRKCGSRRAFAVEVNVGDEASVRSMVEHVVGTCGGIDLFVSNAGVLRAGSVKELSEEDFRFVTDVNYVGFFLCTKHAAPYLALQNRASLSRPRAARYFTDIIQINSKSGLEGSNKNGAYAGSKFGAIGLVQSFALELVEDSVKVNAVCPGNFFDGPLWSDPDRGLFVQYLRAGKVPGATTVADVKRFYEEKVPMKRGCTGPDVVKAILYLVDQEYETGQALPVTGGQVMLR